MWINYDRCFFANSWSVALDCAERGKLLTVICEMEKWFGLQLRHGPSSPRRRRRRWEVLSLASFIKITHLVIHIPISAGALFLCCWLMVRFKCVWSDYGSSCVRKQRHFIECRDIIGQRRLKSDWWGDECWLMMDRFITSSAAGQG